MLPLKALEKAQNKIAQANKLKESITKSTESIEKQTKKLDNLTQILRAPIQELESVINTSKNYATKKTTKANSKGGENQVKQER